MCVCPGYRLPCEVLGLQVNTEYALLVNCTCVYMRACLLTEHLFG
jgi:hypothetical protein